jgi:hypothetical protein
MESGDNTNNTIHDLIDKSKLVKELSGKLVLNESRERDLSAKIEGKKAEGVLIKQSIGKLWGKVGRIFSVGSDRMVRAQGVKFKSVEVSGDFKLGLGTPVRPVGVMVRGFVDSPDVGLDLEGVKYVFWVGEGNNF